MNLLWCGLWRRMIILNPHSCLYKLTMERLPQQTIHSHLLHQEMALLLQILQVSPQLILAQMLNPLPLVIALQVVNQRLEMLQPPNQLHPEMLELPNQLHLETHQTQVLLNQLLETLQMLVLLNLLLEMQEMLTKLIILQTKEEKVLLAVMMAHVSLDAAKMELAVQKMNVKFKLQPRKKIQMLLLLQSQL